MVTRTLRIRCAVPASSVTGPSRRTSASKARGQSSSVPSNSPMMCSTSDTAPPNGNRESAEAGEMVGELPAPGRPVVRDIVAPQVQLVPDPFVGKESGDVPRRVERAGGVLPLALPADQQDRQPAA